MLTTRVMPCLLLRNGALVKTIRFKNPGYVGDPTNAIKIYNEKTNYKEWEFVYDPEKEAGIGGAGGQIGGRPQIPGQSPVQMPGLIPGMNEGLQKRI